MPWGVSAIVMHWSHESGILLQQVVGENSVSISYPVPEAFLAAALAEGVQILTAP